MSAAHLRLALTRRRPRGRRPDLCEVVADMPEAELSARIACRLEGCRPINAWEARRLEEISHLLDYDERARIIKERAEDLRRDWGQGRLNLRELRRILADGNYTLRAP